MANKTRIGDVRVCEGEPPNGNPYRYHGGYVMGDKRAAALRAFRDGGDTTGLTFWHAPAGGGARRLSDPESIDWQGM